MLDSQDADDSEPNVFKSINWKREIILIFVGSILGGLIFTAFSPFIVPHIHDFQVYELGAQNPTLGVHVEYAENVSGDNFQVPKNEEYDRYTVIIQNPSKKILSSVTIGLTFPGVIEAQEVGAYQARDAISYSENAHLVATDEVENFSYISNAIKIDELPPLKEISVTFLIDSTPEQPPIPGYWETAGLSEYNASRGSLMIDGQYRWQFKGTVYTETRQFIYIGREEIPGKSKYDMCIGKKSETICGK